MRLVYRRELGLDLPAYGEIGATELRRIAVEMKRGASGESWRRVDEPQEFDVVAMAGNPAGGRPRSIVHVGTMIDRRRMLHIEGGAGVTAPAIAHPAIRQRILGFYRHASR